MLNTPPPLPADQPPPLPNDSARLGHHKPVGVPAVSRSIIKMWFSVAILAGMASGRLKDEWRNLSSKATDESGLAYVIYIAAVISIAGIIYSLLYLQRRPAMGKLLGMKRSYWQVGVPLAWLFGLGAGFLWRFI